MIPKTGEERAEWLNSLWPDKLEVNRDQIRQCFAVELANYQAGVDLDHYENLYQAALYLHVLGEPGDAILIYDAKMSSFDLHFGMDYQFMLGAGLDKTIEYANQTGRSDMAKYLDGLREDPDLPDIEHWLEFKISYFGLPIQQSNDLADSQ
ncbi:hypothetical protein JXJ21_09990 [candidate division KSB1 bacterium]|nr:hypothetical protein [candidate division KSB1 bacterium]